MLGDTPAGAAPGATPGTSVVVNTTGVSWPAALMMIAGGILIGGAAVYFYGPELGLLEAPRHRRHNAYEGEEE